MLISRLQSVACFVSGGAACSASHVDWSRLYSLAAPCIPLRPGRVSCLIPQTRRPGGLPEAGTLASSQWLPLPSGTARNQGLISDQASGPAHRGLAPSQVVAFPWGQSLFRILNKELGLEPALPCGALADLSSSCRPAKSGRRGIGSRVRQCLVWLPLPALLPCKTRKGQSVSDIVFYSRLAILYVKTVWSARQSYPLVCYSGRHVYFLSSWYQTNKPIWLHKSYFLWKKLNIRVLFFLGFLRSQSPKILIQDEILSYCL